MPPCAASGWVVTAPTPVSRVAVNAVDSAPFRNDFIERSSAESDAPAAGLNSPEPPSVHARRGSARNHGVGTARRGDDDHADAHVERAEHLIARHCPRALEDLEGV